MRNCDPNMTQNWHVCVICCRPEVDFDAISGRIVKTIGDYALVNFEVASSKTFRDNKKKLKSHFVIAKDIDDMTKWRRIRVSFNEAVKRKMGITDSQEVDLESEQETIGRVSILWKLLIRQQQIKTKIIENAKGKLLAEESHSQTMDGILHEAVQLQI